MSKRRGEFFLFDVYVAILKINYTASRYQNAQELLYDFTAWDSVVREFEIVGEATNILIREKVLSDDQRPIVDFRNLLIHNYFGIDPEAVWDVIQTDLPAFEERILLAIAQIGSSLKHTLIESFVEHNSFLPFVQEALRELDK